MQSLHTDWIWKDLKIVGIYNVLEWSPLCKVKKKSATSEISVFLMRVQLVGGLEGSSTVDHHLLLSHFVA